jgi:hypothetical protein
MASGAQGSSSEPVIFDEQVDTEPTHAPLRLASTSTNGSDLEAASHAATAPLRGSGSASSKRTPTPHAARASTGSKDHGSHEISDASTSGFETTDVGAEAAHHEREGSLDDLTGVSLTRPELAAAAGISEVQIEQLESFGLIHGRMVAGAISYDEESLKIANIASSFAKYGIEARHLRVHLHAADREAGFIEQVVLPLFRQRNPEARRRALDTVSELTELGQGLRASLLRSALRDKFGS